MCITYYHDHKSLTLVGICPALDSGFDAAFLVLLCNELALAFLLLLLHTKQQRSATATYSGQQQHNSWKACI